MTFKIRKKWLHITMIFSLILSSIMPSNIVYAYTSNVSQFRYIAEVEEFPESYREGLSLIRALYPNSQFIYYDTGLDWELDFMTESNELMIGRNLISSSSPSSWKSMDPLVYDIDTNTYMEIEPRWNQASPELIKYYADPRNFLDETNIFQFVQLSYNETQTLEATESLLVGSFMDAEKGKIIEDEEGNYLTYGEAIYKIAAEVGVSPYMLASRILQEQSYSGSALCLGHYGDFYGYYNYFNVGAYGPTTDAIITNGLTYAKEHDWSTRYKALYGGAKVVADRYIDSGIDTLYLQHFNVVASGSSDIVSYAPYMTSTLTPWAEAQKLSSCFTDKDAAYTFVIPVYYNMPEEACPCPSGDGNGNYLLKNLSLDNIDIEFSPYEDKYVIYVDGETSYVNLKAVPFTQNTKISINGKLEEANQTEYEKVITLQSGYNEFYVTVTAENETTNNYKLEIIRDNGEPVYSIPKINFTNRYAILEKDISVGILNATSKLLNCSIEIIDNNGNEKSRDDYCASGDIINIKNTNDEIIYSSTILLQGDVNKDGHINELDINEILYDKLEIQYLNSFGYDIANIDRTNNISVVDIAETVEKINEKVIPDDNLFISINTGNDLLMGIPFNATLDVSNGYYVAEGYLNYNNCLIKAEDCNNSGSIHFITWNNHVMFENGESYVKFVPLVKDADAEFSTRITSAFNYKTNQLVEIETSTQIKSIKSEGLTIVQESQKLSENEQSGTAAIIKLSNNTNVDIQDVKIELPSYFITTNKKKEVNIPFLLSGEETSINVKLSEKLPNGLYYTPINYTYNIDGSEYKGRLNSSLTIDKCVHPKTKVISNEVNYHIEKCNTCKFEIQKAHNFNTDGQCTICKRKDVYDININTIKTSKVSSCLIEASITATINDQKDTDYQIEWYVNDIKYSDEKKLCLLTSDMSLQKITAAVLFSNGARYTEEINIMPISVEIEARNSLDIEKATCNSVTFKALEGYEYKMENGMWQKSPTFTNLKADKEYTFYQRKTGITNPLFEKKITIVPKHQVNETQIFKEATCSSDELDIGYCIYCNEGAFKIVPGTKTNHEFLDYTPTKEATCTQGAILSSKCTYCEAVDTKESDILAEHQFSNYVRTSQPTCSLNAIIQANCDFGCGALDVKEEEKTALHHLFNEYNVSDENPNVRIAYCSHGCGMENVIYHKDRMIGYIDIEIDKMTGGQIGMSRIETKSRGVMLYDYELTKKDSDETITKTSPKAYIEENQTYILTKISFELLSGYQYDNYMSIYVNDELANCNYEINNNIITFYDVGRFYTQTEE